MIFLVFSCKRPLFVNWLVTRVTLCKNFYSHWPSFHYVKMIQPEIDTSHLIAPKRNLINQKIIVNSKFSASFCSPFFLRIFQNHRHLSWAQAICRQLESWKKSWDIFRVECLFVGAPFVLKKSFLLFFPLSLFYTEKSLNSNGFNWV